MDSTKSVLYAMMQSSFEQAMRDPSIQTIKDLRFTESVTGADLSWPQEMIAGMVVRTAKALRAMEADIVEPGDPYLGGYMAFFQRQSIDTCPCYECDDACSLWERGWRDGQNDYRETKVKN